MDFLALIESLISSVPEALGLWHKIAPHIAVNADIPQDKLDEIDALAPVVVSGVETAHAAIAALIDTHTPTAAVPTTPPAAA